MTQVQQSPEEQTAVALQWMADICPTGLKTARGSLTRSDVEKIGEFIDRNHGGVWSTDAMNDAVEKLSNVLTWFDDSPEARAVRGQPVKQRVLSDQALRDAGIELMAQIAKNILQTVPEELRNPWKTKAEALVVQNRQGRIDAYLTQELRKVLATNTRTGEVDWQRTHDLRVKFQDAIDNRRNMQTRPGRPIG